MILMLQIQKDKCYLSFTTRKICVSKTWCKKERKVAYNAGGNETKIDLVCMGKEHWRYLNDVKVISGDLQHELVVANVDRKKLSSRVTRNKVLRRRLWKLIGNLVRNIFKHRVQSLEDIEAPDQR